ncbi:non-phototropic hypocotyl 3-like [Oryza sativa Japonica Group]|uniref:Non-phototropic hypocotyl 3-like n=2 Tax=Oryza sativa subsp. japonica TaxID=39947 RepID=Q5JKK7_ORYSJ|nr:non-phototropic hypocotyl 3-like [Oryza sativa Japonica Group]BAD88004.1 non-phototropic hypocotyl 3-like [Oryza sativa Japonica Group]
MVPPQAEAEAEAVAHAVQNDRLPVRSVLQMLFSEHGKLNRLAELSGGASFGAPSLVFDLPGARCPPSARCSPSTTSSAASARTSPASSALQAQVDRLSMERRWHGGGGGFFKWSTFWFGGMSSDVARVEDSESGIERRTPASGKKGRGGALD